MSRPRTVLLIFVLAFALLPSAGIAAGPPDPDLPAGVENPFPSIDGEVAVQVAAGGYHTCALTARGAVWCWGDNAYGQLGNATREDSTVPVPVSGLDPAVTAITAGASHTCALTPGRVVKCWGSNYYKQLGVTGIEYSTVPIPVGELPAGADEVQAGLYHTCALAGHGLKCWGWNAFGQLGIGNKITTEVPTDVTNMASGVAMVRGGQYHTCALKLDGSAWCWGYNEYGQLGNNSTAESTVPVAVSTSAFITYLATGPQHTCARTSDGAALCWGNNAYGQLGDGTTTHRKAPVQVYDLAANVVQIVASTWHTCARVGLAVKCWGGNSLGQIGDGTATGRPTPTAVTDLGAEAVALTAGWSHTCALTAWGGIKCWGSDYYGQRGDGRTSSQRTPVEVPGLAGSIRVSAGRGTSCALSPDGGLRCWGYNAGGELGDGTMTGRYVPAFANGLQSDVLEISSGSGDHRCVLEIDGDIRCWGQNYDGALGNGTTTPSPVPVQVIGAAPASSVAAGMWHTCTRTQAGDAQCWGDGYSGQLGNGGTADTSSPVDVLGMAAGSVRAVSAGGYHSCALVNTSGVKCWGNNLYGQLGNPGAGTSSSTPVDVAGLSDVVGISLGDYHSCALVAGNKVKCWGRNDRGQLGTGDTTNRSEPVEVTGVSGQALQVIVGAGPTTCALLVGDQVKCWGANGGGQLSDGTLQDSLTPVPVNGITGVRSFSMGADHACAVTSGGVVKCWGSNNYGAVGVPPIWTPVRVVGFGKLVYLPALRK